MKSLKMFYAASLLLAALLVPSLHAQAQNRPAREGKAGGSPGERFKNLSEQLSLTEAQQTKVRAVYTEQTAAMKALADDTALSDQDRRAKRMELQRSTNAKVRALLTPDQQAKFDKLVASGPGGKAGAAASKGGGKGKRKKAE